VGGYGPVCANLAEGYQYCYFLRKTTRTEVVLLKVSYSSDQSRSSQPEKVIFITAPFSPSTAS
jgi:hypothetical protein